MGGVGLARDSGFVSLVWVDIAQSLKGQKEGSYAMRLSISRLTTQILYQVSTLSGCRWLDIPT
jgi:hypothetical protein